jgi:hypothetical protein
MHWFQSGATTWDAGISHPATAAVLSFDAAINGDALATIKAGATGIVNTQCPDYNGLDEQGNACDFLQVNYSTFPSVVNYGSYVNLNVTGPGGNSGGAGTRVSNVTEFATYNNARGQSRGNRTLMYHNGVGDTAGYYLNSYFDGGSPDANAEGISSATLQTYENHGYYHGTVTSGGGMGATTPTLTFTTGSGQNHTTDGAFLLDITQKTLTANLNALSGPGKYHIATLAPTDATYLQYLPVTGATLPLTTAWGTLQAFLPATGQAANIGVNSGSVTVNLSPIGSSTPTFISGMACIAGSTAAEQVYLNAGSTSGSTQTVNFLYRKYHAANDAIFQGGLCGQFLTFPGDVTLTNQRLAYYAFGSLEGTNLIYGFYGSGLYIPAVPRLGDSSETYTSQFEIYPGAEVVQNQPVAGGTVQLEPNSVNWTTNDLVENPHYPYMTGNGLWLVDYKETPPTPGEADAAESIDVSGPGISGTYRPLFIGNGNSCTNYTICGGPLAMPYAAAYVGGYFNSDLELQYAPGVSNGGIISVADGTNVGLAPTNIFYDETYHGYISYDFSGATSFKFYNPLSTAPMTFQGSPICTVANELCGPVVASLTTTSGTSDTVTFTGVTATIVHCSQPGATNASASTAVGTYISAKSAGSITVTHAATAGMKYDILCTTY